METFRGLRWFRTGLMVLGLLGLSVGARAYDAPPQRAARLSFLQGSVTVEHTDNTGSDPAVVNMPLAAGVRVATGEDGQAEIEFEDGSLVRLTPNSALSLNVLSADAAGNFQTQLAVVHGLIYSELRSAEKFTYSIDANGDEISPVTNTTIRIDLDEPVAVISVLDGTARVEHRDSQNGVGDQAEVQSGQTLTRDSVDGSRFVLSQEIAQNSWDAWNEDRDQAAADEAANQTAARDDYAGSQGYGWSDLDANGTWYNVPGQGMVWQPNVAADAGFDPYGYGSWVYYPGTGYVWASGYGWGWTPFRCGNWSYWDGFGWGWLPGSGCGLGGWGFGGGGYAINVIQPPRNYRFPPRPVRGSGPSRPIHIGRPSRWEGGGAPDFRGPRSIAGKTAEPLRPVGRGQTPRGGSAVGSSLRRDYPVDRNSRKPEMGVTAPVSPGSTLGTTPGAITRQPGRPGNPPRPSNQPSQPNPPNPSSPSSPRNPPNSQGGDSGSALRRGTMRQPPPATDSTQGDRTPRGRGDRPAQQTPTQPPAPQTPTVQPPSPQPPATVTRPVQPNPTPRPTAPPPQQVAPRPETPRQEAPRQEMPRPQRPQDSAPRPMPPSQGPRSMPPPSFRPESRAPSPPPPAPRPAPPPAPAPSPK